MHNSETPMRALVWNNPYGALMLHGKIETRKKPTNVRGKVLICTAKEPYNVFTVDEISGEEQGRRMVTLLGMESDNVGKLSFTYQPAKLNGYAIGVGELTDCRLMRKTDEHDTFVKYDSSVERYCWIFKNVRRIKPFEWKFGKQGWLFVPDSELTKIIYL
jgi:hypothetical protein